jgi:hypothetical protein
MIEKISIRKTQNKANISFEQQAVISLIFEALNIIGGRFLDVLQEKIT